MNGFSESSLIIESSDAVTKNVPFQVEALRPRRIRTPMHSASVRKPTVVDSRINSLKILALTLLREIESLERQSDNETPADINLQDEVRHFEAELIRSALIRTGGRQRRAARLLGMKVTTLNTRIRRYGIVLNDDELNIKNGSGSPQRVN